MADTPKIDLTIKDTPKMNLSNPYNTFNPLYELVSNKIITEDEVTETAPYFSAEATKEYLQSQLKTMSDMFKEEYDSDGNGVVDNADTLNGLSSDNIFEIMEVRANKCFTYDDFNSLAPFVNDKDIAIAKKIMPGNIMIIQEDDFPHLIVTCRNVDIEFGVDLSSLRPLNKERALELLLTQGYFDSRSGIRWEVLGGIKNLFVDIHPVMRDGDIVVECDKSPSEILNLIESGHNVKLKLNLSDMGVDNNVFICELKQIRENGELFFVSMQSPDMYYDVTGNTTTDTWSVFFHQSMYQEYVQNYVDETIQSAIYDSWEEEV